MRRVLFAALILMTLALSLTLLAEDKKPAAPAESVADMINAGKFAEAIAAADKMVAAGTADSSIYLNLAVAHYKLKDFPKAIENCEKAAAMDPTSTLPYEYLATAYGPEGLNDDAKALEAYERALVVDPMKKEVLFNAAALLEKMGRLDDALAKYDQLLQIDPTFKNVAYNVGVMLYEKNDFARAETYLKQALASQPDNEDLLKAAAAVLTKEQKWADAVPVYKKLLEVNKKETLKVALTQNLALCQLQAKQYDDAVASAEQVLAVRANDERSMLIRSIALINKGDCARIQPAAESYLAVSKDTSNRAVVMKGVGKCQYDAKKFKEAVATYEQVLAINGSDEDALLYAGNSYIQLKNNAKALACFKKLASVAKDPALKASAQKNVRNLGG